MQLQTFFLVLSLLVFFFALGIRLSARRSLFARYEGISKDVQQLARILKAETLRDGADLVVRGNHNQRPVVVRFSADGASSLNIMMEAPANFQMSVAPRSAREREGKTVVPTNDGLFDFKFTSSSNDPSLAKMFVGSAGTLQLIKKLCWSSATSLRIVSGRLQLQERPFDFPHVSSAVQGRLAVMADLAAKLCAMPGADAIRIVPFRKPGNRLVQAAVVAALMAALFEAGSIGSDAPQQSVLASQRAAPSGLLLDGGPILYLQGWRLAQESDFDPEAAGWMKAQGVTPIGILHGDFSGKNNSRDVAYILIDDRGIMRVVLLSDGRLVYDQRYRRILAAARVPASQLATAAWREPLPSKPEGDGLLIVTKLDMAASSLVIMLRDGRVVLNAPADYQRLNVL